MGEGLVVDDFLGHAPLLKCLVEFIKAQGSLALLEVIFKLEVGSEFAVEHQEFVKGLNIAVCELESKRLMIRLLREVLI